MSDIAEYRQGTPCWVDLWTKDRPAAMDFYTAVLGWEYQVGPADQHFYTIAKVSGRAVGGIVTPPGNDQAPVTWVTYLSADDLEGTLAAAQEHGGRSMTGVIAVPGAEGIRIAIVLDPSGAVVGAWQATGHRGAEVGNEPGAVIWTELMTRDAKAARSFYSDVFGVGISEPMSADFDYTTVRVEDRDVAGIWSVGEDIPAEVPAHWEVYFGVADTDATADAVRAAGGVVLGEPKDTPYGRMASFTDPQGGAFSVMSVTTRD
jgi:uncharacterized protein